MRCCSRKSSCSDGLTGNGRYGRLVVRLDAEVEAEVRVSSGVLIVPLPVPAIVAESVAVAGVARTNGDSEFVVPQMTFTPVSSDVVTLPQLVPSWWNICSAASLVYDTPV